MIFRKEYAKQLIVLKTKKERDDSWLFQIIV
jgi:hypothetical protein